MSFECDVCQTKQTAHHNLPQSMKNIISTDVLKYTIIV